MNLIFLAQSLNDCVRSNSGECQTGLPAVQATSGQIHTFVQLAFAIIGVIALFIVMFAGFRLITSQGNPEALGRARQTLIYAAVGLLVAVSAEIIVSLVISKT